MYINVTSEVDFYGTLKKIYTRSKIYGTLFSFSSGILKCGNFFLRVIDRSLLETETKRKAMNFFFIHNRGNNKRRKSIYK